MTRLGPFEPSPRLALAVSGGADSLAMAVLARGWARDRGGDCLGLIVDHGLRQAAGAEAAHAACVLKALGMASRVIVLDGLARGPGLAARARLARHAALADAAAAACRLHLLLGHHAGDQAETCALRREDGSGAAGLAGMAGVRETACVRLLRPLLAVPPEALRALLREAGIAWVDDPSNVDPLSRRAVLRAELDRSGARDALLAAAAQAGRSRGAGERDVAYELAGRAELSSLGFARFAPPLSAAGLGALLQAVQGGRYPLAASSVARLAAAPRAATLGGVRLLAGRGGGAGMSGWWVVRERPQGPVAAVDGARWDGRFTLRRACEGKDGLERLSLGAVGADASWMRRLGALRPFGWPAALVASLPVVRDEAGPWAAPWLGWWRDPDAQTRRMALDFTPARPLAAAAFCEMPQTSISGFDRDA